MIWSLPVVTRPIIPQAASARARAPIQQRRAGADAVVEAVERQVLVRRVVCLVGIAVGRHERLDAEDFGERIARQAAEAGRIEQRLDAVRGERRPGAPAPRAPR